MQYLVFDNEVGLGHLKGPDGGWAGNPEHTPFPQQMLIDRVTVWRRRPAAAAAAATGGATLRSTATTRPIITAADMATTNRTAFSTEGSWSYLQLSPGNATANPFSLGVLNLLSFRSLWPDVLSATVAGRPCTLDPVSAGGYVWRPDVVTLRGSCAGSAETRSRARANISMQIAYHGNATICARYTLDTPGNWTFAGRLPPDTSGSQPNAISTESRTTTASILERKHLLVKMEAYTAMLSLNTSLNRFWLLRSDLAREMSLDAQSGAYHVEATDTASATFCLDELYSAPGSGALVKTPAFDASAATADVNGWMAEATPPPGLSRSDVIKYGSSWLQFWLNTEHSTTGVPIGLLSGDGNWAHDVVCPSKSKYARGIWEWDTGFHVLSLITAGAGPRSLKKAEDQLSVMMTATLKLGKTPCCVGAAAVEDCVQPPGILSWAAMSLYTVTQDLGFLKDAYRAFSLNNEALYAERAEPSGLCTWSAWDTGWDTSPRWDHGDVQAIDLNSWLHLDQLLLAQMATILKMPPNETDKWANRAAASKRSIQTTLWSEEHGVFFDRLPVNVPRRYTDCSALPGPLSACPQWKFKPSGSANGGCPGMADSACACGPPCESALGCQTCDCCVLPGTRRLPANRSDALVELITPATFFSLLAGVATDDQARKMVNATLNPENLLTRYPLPVVGRSEAAFDPNDYWRGPTWVNINWLSLLGLECYGFAEEARRLRLSINQLVKEVPREYYNPLDGTGLGAENFMWTGAINMIVFHELHGPTVARSVLHAALGGQCNASSSAAVDQHARRKF